MTLGYHNSGFKTLFSVGIDCMRQCITRKTVGLVRVQYLVAIVELYRLEHCVWEILSQSSACLLWMSIKI